MLQVICLMTDEPACTIVVLLAGQQRLRWIYASVLFARAIAACIHKVWIVRRHRQNFEFYTHLLAALRVYAVSTTISSAGLCFWCLLETKIRFSPHNEHITI